MSGAILWMSDEAKGSAVNSDLLQGFYLGDLLVEPLKGQVSGQAGTQHLPPKAVEVLLCLATEPGELVTREILLDDVWGVGHGSQEALSHAISEIRHALDDHPDNPVFLQTLPKRGYRLLVEPELAGENTSTAVLGTPHGVRVADISLLENLKQRGVLETVLAYLVVGWLLIQIADIVFGQLHFPAWAGTFVTVLVIAGFPIAVVLSWYLEFRDGRAVVHRLSAADSRRRRFSRTYMSVVAALGIAGLLVFVYDLSVGLPEPPIEAIEIAKLPPIVQNSFAVLPFLNLDGSDETGVFANGLVDDVITRLSRVPGLRVSSRGDSFTLAPNTASQKVRERLRVEMYLEGSVEMAGDKIRVIVQLIDSATGFHVSSRSFDKPRESFFDIRDEITSLTVANVRVALPANTRSSSLQTSDEPTFDVYVLYRRGVDASRLPDSIDNINTALKWYEAALVIDPDYAAAHAGKCAMYVDGYTEVDDALFIAQAKSACEKALALNPNLDVVHTSLGDLYTATGRLPLAEDAYLDALSVDSENVAALIGLGEVYRQLRRPGAAEASIQQAIGLHPGDWSAYNALGNFLYRSGRFAEAAEQYKSTVALDSSNVRGHTNLASALMLAEDFEAAEPAFRRVLELEPSGLTYSNFGMLLYILGRFDESIELHRKAVEIEGQQGYLARSNLGDALWAAGLITEASAEFEVAEALAIDALVVNPNDAFILMDLAWIKTVLGKKTEAGELIQRAMQMVPDDPYVHYIYGLMLNRGGDATGALAALGTAVDLGYSTKMLSIDPNLANLREEKRFEDLFGLSE